MIEIIDNYVIFTKDAEYMNQLTLGMMESGAFILLPPDAVIALLPKNEPVQEKVEKKQKDGFVKFEPTPRGTPKPCCGSKGTRHMKGCGGESVKAELAPVNEKEFLEIKRKQKDGSTAIDIIDEYGISLKDANEIFKAPMQYDFYTRHRKDKGSK